MNKKIKRIEKLKLIRNGFLFIFLTFVTVLCTLDWFDRYYRQEAYQKVARQLATLNKFKPHQLYHLLVENKIQTNEIKLSIEFFFEKMTKRVTGKSIKVVLSPIKAWNLKAVNTLLLHMMIMEKAKAAVDQFSARPEAGQIKELYQAILQYYADVWYNEDCKAIQLLSNGKFGIKIKQENNFKQVVKLWPLFLCKFI